MRHTAHIKRRPRRSVLLFPLLVLFLLVVVGGLALFRFLTSPSAYRQTIVIVGEPMRIVSLHNNKRTITMLEVPVTTNVSALSGYGQYSLSSLWELDQIDKKQGVLFTTSIADAFGIPLLGYVENKLTSSETPIAYLHDVFSWSSIFPVLSGSVKTSLTKSQWLSWVIAIQSAKSEDVETIDIAQTIVDMPSPDGQLVPILDESKLNYVLDKRFFDIGLRNEGLSVALYNTTSVPLVGQRVARQLSRMGILMVFVGNAQDDLESCVLSGSKEALQSKTASFIRDYFECVDADAKAPSVGRETGADVIMQLGIRDAKEYSK